MDCRARGDAGQDALLACQPAGAGERFFIRHDNDFIENRAIQNLGDEPHANARHTMLASRPARENRGPGRLHGNHAHRGLPCFSTSPPPAIVPPAPTPQTRPSPPPPPSSHTSTPHPP